LKYIKYIILSFWSDWSSSSAMFLKEEEDILETLSSNVCDQTFMQGKKKRENKENNKSEK